MIKNLVNLFKGINQKMDDASIREMNRMELDFDKVMIEREIALGADRFIRRI